MSPPIYTEPEKQAVFRAMQHFGPCTCQASGSLYNRVCAGHLFIAETDRKVDRLDHMLFVRRTVRSWLDAEMMGLPHPRYEDHPGEPEVLPEAAPPDKLPW